MNCLNCKKKLTGYQKKFCSRSCAAKINNKTPKRKRTQRFCQKCNKDITYEYYWEIRRKFCLECRPTVTQKQDLTKKRIKSSTFCKTCNKRIFYRASYCSKECNPNFKNWEKISLSDLQNKRKYQISSRIRNLARAKYLKTDLPKHCINCGYNKIYHVCHKKAIKDFSQESTVGEINDLSNLIALCPNCHYEFDNGMLEL